MIIQEIAFGSTLYESSKSFRNAILRLPLGLALSKDDLAGEDKQFHIVAIENNNIVGTVILKPISDKRLKLRQMAVSPDLQAKGMGRELVRFAEELAQKKNYPTIEMIARVSAQGFYEKLGYRSQGDVFIEMTVPAIIMSKEIELISLI